MSSFNIVVLNWNDESDTTNCIETILDRTHYDDYRIIVVDNGSKPESFQTVKQYAEEHSQVHIIRNFENHGFAYGNNKGIRHSHADYYILLNNDTEVPAGWLQEAEKRLEKLDDGVVGFKLLNPDGTVQHAGHSVTSTEIPNHTDDFDGARRMDAVQGAAFCIPHTVVQDVGYLDTWYYPIYREETDYCLRARRRGYPVYILSEPAITHTRDDRATADSKFYQTRINDLRFATLQHGLLDWMKRIPLESRFLAAAVVNHRGRRDIFKRIYKEWVLELPGLLRERVRRYRTGQYVPQEEAPRALQ